MNLNPAACSGGTTVPGPAGGGAPSPFQPRDSCSPEKAQREGSIGRARVRLPPQHVAIYRKEGDTTLARRELDEERSYVHGKEGTRPEPHGEHRAPAPARSTPSSCRGGATLEIVSTGRGGSLPSSAGDEGVVGPSGQPQAPPPPCHQPGLLRALRSPRAGAFTPAQPRFHGKGEGDVPSPIAAGGSLGTQSGGGTDGEGVRHGASPARAAWCRGQGGGENPRGPAWPLGRQ